MIAILNWSDFQQYKDREPKWIKLHRTLLDNPQWGALTGDEAKLLIELWLLAARCGRDGNIDRNPAEIAWTLRRDAENVENLISALVRNNFLEYVQDCTEPYESVPREEKRREEKRREEGRVTPTAAAVGSFIESVGSKWKLDASINEWAADLDGNPKYAGIDLVHEIQLCAEWHVQQGKTPKAPTSSIHNWLKRAKPTANGTTRKKRGQQYQRLRAT